MRGIRLLLTVALAVALSLAIFMEVEPEKFSEALKRLSAQTLVSALLLLTVDYLLRALRWHLMLKHLGSTAGMKACLGPLLAGYALNNLLPLRLGDVARIFVFKDQLGLRSEKIAATLLIERLLDVFFLGGAFLLGVCFVTHQSFDGAFIHVVKAMGVFLVTLFGVMIVAPVQLVSAMHWLTHRLLPRRFQAASIVRFFASAMKATIELGDQGTLVKLALLSLPIWLSEAAVFYTIVASINNDFPAMGGLFSMATGTLATMLPSTPGYVGTFDFFAVQGMRAFDVDYSDATVAVIVIHTILWFPITVVGASWLLRHWGKAFTEKLVSLRQVNTHE